MFIRRAAPLLLLTACTQGPSGDADILAIGDSLLDFNTPDEDVTSVAAEALGMSHEFAAIGGTTMLGDDAIGDQYVEGAFELLIASGGGNDLGEGCVCGEDCASVIDELIDESGSSGAIVDVVERAVSDGKRVAWVGYMRPMDSAEEFSTCDAELDVIRERMTTLDEQQPDMVFVDSATFGTGVETELYAEDGYHPSPQGSAAIGEALAEQVQSEWFE